MFGKEGPKNAVHGSDSIESAERELNFFFSLETDLSYFDKNLSCLIIKPHILKEKKMGIILD